MTGVAQQRGQLVRGGRTLPAHVARRVRDQLLVGGGEVGGRVPARGEEREQQ